MEKGEIYELAKKPIKSCAKQATRSEGEAMGILRYDDTRRIEADIHDENIAYGCLFCITGREQSVAERVRASCPDVRAIVMRKIKYRVSQKIKRTEEEIILPGYVFFQAPFNIEPLLVFPRQDVIRMLSMDGDWRLHGADEQFTRWLFQYDGLLGLSQAYRDGDRIRIISGPMKDAEGRISRVDKRGCSGQVLLSFNGREITTWLNFELIDRND